MGKLDFVDFEVLYTKSRGILTSLDQLEKDYPNDQEFGEHVRKVLRTLREE